jgi:cell wall-associated NlpC family hydrolase
VRLAIGLVGAVGTVLAAATGPALAVPGRPGLGGPAEDPGTTKARIAALYQEADQLTQAYDAAQERAEMLSAAVRRSQAELEAARIDFAQQQSDLGMMAAAQYRAGVLDKRLSLMLADHPETFLSSSALMDRLGDEQLARVAQAIDSRRRLAQLQQTATDQLAALAQTRADVEARRHDVAMQLQQAQSLVNTLSFTQRGQIAAADLGADPSDPGAADTPALLTPLLEVPATGRARTAIAAAYGLLGHPYVYGAEGPVGFDCSGLVQAVWRQAGVELPRTSSEQALAGRPVAAGDIQPGDLVVYYKGRNHIGIYIGDGKIIHAPHPGSQVRISPLNSMPVDMVVRV